MFCSRHTFLWPYVGYWTLDGSAWHHNYHGYTTASLASNGQGRIKSQQAFNTIPIQMQWFNNIFVKVRQLQFCWMYSSVKTKKAESRISQSKSRVFLRQINIYIDAPKNWRDTSKKGAAMVHPFPSPWTKFQVFSELSKNVYMSRNLPLWMVHGHLRSIW